MSEAFYGTSITRKPAPSNEQLGSLKDAFFAQPPALSNASVNQPGASNPLLTSRFQNANNQKLADMNTANAYRNWGQFQRAYYPAASQLDASQLAAMTGNARAAWGYSLDRQNDAMRRYQALPGQLSLLGSMLNSPLYS